MMESLKNWLIDNVTHHDQQKRIDLKRNRAYHSTFSVAYNSVLNKINELEKQREDNPVT